MRTAGRDRAYVCADDGRRYRPFNMACDMSVNSDLLSAYSAQRDDPKTQREHLSLVSSETEPSGNAQKSVSGSPEGFGP